MSNVEAGADSPAIKETKLSGMFPFRSVTKMEPDGNGTEFSANWKHSFQMYVSNYYQDYYSVVSETGKPYPFTRRDCNSAPCADGVPYEMESEDGLNRTKFYAVYENQIPMKFVWVKEDGRRYYFRTCYDFADDYRPELFGNVASDCYRGDPAGLRDSPESARLEKIVAADGVHSMSLSYNLPTESWNAAQGKWELAHDCVDWQLRQVVTDTGMPVDFEYGACHVFTECFDEDFRLVSCDDPQYPQTPRVTEVPSLKAVRVNAADVDLVRYDYDVVNYGSALFSEDDRLPWGHDLVLSRAHHYSNGNYSNTEIYDYQMPGFGIDKTLAKDSGYMKTIGGARTPDGPEEATVLSVEYASTANGHFGDATAYPEKYVQACSEGPDTVNYPLDEFFLSNCFIATGKDFRLFFDGGKRSIEEASTPVVIDLVKGDFTSYVVERSGGSSAMVVKSKTLDGCSNCASEFTYGDDGVLCPGENGVPNLCGVKKRDGSYAKYKWDERGNLRKVIKGLWDLDPAAESDGVATDYKYRDPSDPKGATVKTDLFGDGRNVDLPDNRLVVVSSRFDRDQNAYRQAFYFYNQQTLAPKPLGKCERGVADNTWKVFRTSYQYDDDWHVTQELVEEVIGCFASDGTVLKKTDFVYYSGAPGTETDCQNSDFWHKGRLCKAISHTVFPTDDSKALVTLYRTYDLYGNPTEIVEPSGRWLITQYDYDGKVTSTNVWSSTGEKSETVYSYDAARELSQVVLPDQTRQSYSYVRIDGSYGHAGPFMAETKREVFSATGALVGSHAKTISSRFPQGGARIPNAKFVRDNYETPGQSSAREELIIEEKTADLWGEQKKDVIKILNMDNTSKYRAIFRDWGVFDPDTLKTATLETTLFEDHSDIRPNQKVAYIDEFGRTYKVKRKTTNPLTGVIEEVTTRYRFDGGGNLSEVVDGNGNSTAYLYDAFDRLYWSVDPSTHESMYKYDGRGLLVSKGTSAKKEDQGGNPVSFSTGSATYAYDLAARLVAVTQTAYADPDLGTPERTAEVKYLYDNYDPAAIPRGACAGAFGALAPDVFNNGRGRLTAVQAGDSATTFLIYDGFGNVAKELSAVSGLTACQVTAYEHDLRGNITKTTSPAGKVYTRTYAAGNVSSIDLKYDPAESPVNIAQQVNWRIEGSIAGYTGLDGMQFKFEYSTAGFVKKITTENGGTPPIFSENIGYSGRDARHNIVESTIDGKALFYEYDGEQRLARAFHDVAGTPGPEWLRKFTYDSAGNRATQILENGAPSKSETYSYATNASGQSTEMLEEVIDPILTPATADGKSPLRIGFNYEINNLIKTCRDSAANGGKHFFAHERCAGTIAGDLRDLLEKYKVDKFVFVRALLRDADFAKTFGEVLKFRASRDGVFNKDADLPLVNAVLDRLDAMNILTSVEAEETAVAAAEQPAITAAPSLVYQHDGFGNVVKEAAHVLENDVHKGGMVLCYDYDAMGRLSNIFLDSSWSQVELKVPGTQDPLQPKDWARGYTCLRDDVTHEYGDAAELAAFRYDFKGRRVFQRYYAEPDKYFVFDKQDNLLAELANEGTTIKEYVWIGLKPVAQIVYGELQEQPAPGCSPSGGCQPTQCSMTGNGTESFGQGLFYVLIFVVAPGLCYVMVRRGRGQPAGKRAHGAVVTLSAVFVGAASLVVLKCTPTTYAKPVIFYYHNDHLETPMKMTDRAGKVAWEVTKKYPFGDFVYESHSGAFKDAAGGDVAGVSPVNNLRFPGQYDGTDVRGYLIQGGKGPYYNWNRWYNPGTGRYLSSDPLLADPIGSVLTKLGRSQGSSDFWYLYSGSNPLMFLDSDGLKKCPPGQHSETDPFNTASCIGEKMPEDWLVACCIGSGKGGKVKKYLWKGVQNICCGIFGLKTLLDVAECVDKNTKCVPDQEDECERRKKENETLDPRKPIF